MRRGVVGGSATSFSSSSTRLRRARRAFSASAVVLLGLGEDAGEVDAVDVGVVEVAAVEEMRLA